MKLPVLIPALPSQRYSCHSCAGCCRELVAELTDADRRTLDRQGWEKRLGEPVYVRWGGHYVLRHRPGVGCIFLMDDGRCRIHAELGFEAKPLACRLYPFTFQAEGAGLRLGLRFDCPSVAHSRGQPLREHRRDLVRFAEEQARTAPHQLGEPATRTWLRRGRALTTRELDRLIERVDGWVANAGRPLGARLRGLCALAHLLDTATTAGIAGERFEELIDLVCADLSQLADEGADSAPPTPRQRALLRQAVFAHSEYVEASHIGEGLLARWRHRLRQLSRARRMIRGTGEVPDLCGHAGRATFADIESAAPRLSDTAEPANELVTRYLRVRLLSRNCFGAEYYGWPLVDGLRALMLATAAVGWLARCFAAAAGQRTFGIDEIARAVGVVDRGAGRAPELGSRSARLRILFLAADHGLERLLAAYPLIGQTRGEGRSAT